VAEAAELHSPGGGRAHRFPAMAALQLEHSLQLLKQAGGPRRGGRPQVALGRLAEFQEADLAGVAWPQRAHPGRGRGRVVVILNRGTAWWLQAVEGDLTPLMEDADLVTVDQDLDHLATQARGNRVARRAEADGREVVHLAALAAGDRR